MPAQKAPGGWLCASGRHLWIVQESAEKCCAGWHRELRVYHAGHPVNHGTGLDASYGHVWSQDEVRSST